MRFFLNNYFKMAKMRSDTYHKGKYYVNLKRGFEDIKRNITITIDKIFDNDSLRILLSDDEDPNFLCILNVTRCDYEDLKKQQGLLIDFDNFPAQLIRLLQQCATNNMFLIMQQSNPLKLYFEVVEHNEFKRLVHLSLKTAPASDTEIKKHMADNIAQLKNTLLAVKSSLSSSEALWNDKCITMERKIHDLALAISKMEEDKLRRETEHQEALRNEKDRWAQEKHKWQRSSEASTQAQVSGLHEVVARKDKQLEELEATARQLRDKCTLLDNQLSDRNQRINFLEKEVQKTHIEVATTKAKNSALERDAMEKERQNHQLSTKCDDLEKTLRENYDTIKELQATIQLLKKEKAHLEERLVRSEAAEHAGGSAARAAADQLLKANQIIARLNADLLEMKDKLLCRTEIALEQEKVIEKNMKEMEDLKTELTSSKQASEKLKGDLDSLREKHESNEKALKDKEEIIKNNNMVIEWLHKKMEDNCVDKEQSAKRNMAASSTPYHTQSNSDQLSDDFSINFYATSKLPNDDDSPRGAAPPARGLDPRYLAPAAENAPTSNNYRKGTEKPSTSSQKGKENVNLPKVDYREKKSAKSSTYRATPVSAYFP